MQHAYAGNNITGTTGLIAVDKVGNMVRFYDPQTLTAIDLKTKKAAAAHDGGSGIEVLCWY